MILFECPDMIGPLDTATLARCQIIPFLGRERHDSRILEQKILPMDRALCPGRNGSVLEMGPLHQGLEDTVTVRPYEFNPYSASLDIFFSEIVLILCSALHPKNRTPVMQIWHKKSTNHGAW